MRAFFEFIQRYISKLYLFRIIRQYQMGVRLWCGLWRKTLMPGFHWVCPMFGEIIMQDVKRQVVNLPDQSVGTLAISGAVEYEITDPRKALLEVQDLDTSLQNMAMGVIADYVSTALKDDDEDNTESLSDHLTQEMRVIAKQHWGVVVHRLWVTDYAPHRVHRLLMQSRPLETEYED